jgi:hypothetical protein
VAQLGSHVEPGGYRVGSHAASLPADLEGAQGRALQRGVDEGVDERTIGRNVASFGGRHLADRAAYLGVAERVQVPYMRILGRPRRTTSKSQRPRYSLLPPYTSCLFM